MEGPLVHCDVVTIPVHQHFGEILRPARLAPTSTRQRHLDPPHFPIVAYMCLLGSLFRVSAQSKCVTSKASASHSPSSGPFQASSVMLLTRSQNLQEKDGTCVDSHFAKEKGMNPSAGTKSRRKQQTTKPVAICSRRLAESLAGKKK